MADKSKLWYLENFNMFQGLNEEHMMRLDKITNDKEFSKSHPIYFPNEPSSSIYFLKKGRVKLTRTSHDGKEMILALVNPGEVFGEMAMIDDGERTDLAVAIDSCMICAVSKDDFKKFLEDNPELNLKITKLIGLKLRKYSERIEELVFKDAPQRVISFLLNLATDHGKKIGDEIFIKPFLTHQNIAELTACSRQTVNSVLTELREKGIIDFDRRKLIIHDENEMSKSIM